MLTEYYIQSKTTDIIINCVMSVKTPEELMAAMPNVDWERYKLNANPDKRSLMEYEFYSKRP